MGNEKMKGIIFVNLLVLCFFAVPVQVFGLDSNNPGRHGKQAAFIPDELLVKYKADTHDRTKGYYQERWGFQHLRYFKSIGVDHVKLPQGMSVERALKIYRKDQSVEYAEPNYYQYAIIINMQM
jgi:hypothetical protein